MGNPAFATPIYASVYGKYGRDKSRAPIDSGLNHPSVPFPIMSNGSTVEATFEKILQQSGDSERPDYVGHINTKS
jgi:hypothetical protein